MKYNESTDIKQFENYKSLLGGDAPKTFEEFQTTKYEQPEKWNRLKYKYRTVNRYDNEGSVPSSKIIELDNAVWYTKQKGFDYTKYTGKKRKHIKDIKSSGNAACMEFEGDKFFAHSKAS